MLGKIISSSAQGVTWKFAHINISPEQIFLTTPNVIGLINLKPSVPGHVLICSKRQVARLKDLNNEEIADLWLSVAETQRMLEHKYKRPCSFAVQDGTDAGQTVPHVHIHLYPEYIKGEIESQPSGERQPRLMMDMADEAKLYKEYLEMNKLAE